MWKAEWLPSQIFFKGMHIVLHITPPPIPPHTLSNTHATPHTLRVPLFGFFVEYYLLRRHLYFETSGS